jgi:hypothetical protein
MLGDGTLLGLHQHAKQKSTAPASELCPGLDHMSFASADRAALERWEERLERLPVDLLSRRENAPPPQSGGSAICGGGDEILDGDVEASIALDGHAGLLPPAEARTTPATRWRGWFEAMRAVG